jgi:TRAP-type uncharacterized transport system substrate-binding protein
MGAVILNTKSGANMSLIVELARKLKIDVMPLSSEEIEEIEDQKLLKRMKKSLKSGIADREEMFKLLGRETGA